MSEELPYISKIYENLKVAYPNDFKRSPEEFNTLMKDSVYRSNIYDNLKHAFPNDFTRTKDEFNALLDNKPLPEEKPFYTLEEPTPGAQDLSNVKLPKTKTDKTDKKGNNLDQLYNVLGKQDNLKNSGMYGETSTLPKTSLEIEKKLNDEETAAKYIKDAKYQAPTVTQAEKDQLSIENYGKILNNKMAKIGGEAQAVNDELVTKYQAKKNELIQADPNYIGLMDGINTQVQEFGKNLVAQYKQQIQGKQLNANEANQLNAEINQKTQEYSNQLLKENEPKLREIETKYLDQIQTEYSNDWDKFQKDALKPDTNILPVSILDNGLKLVRSDAFEGQSYDEKQNTVAGYWKRQEQALRKKGIKEGTLKSMRDEFYYSIIPHLTRDEKQNVSAFAVRSFADEQLEPLDVKIKEVEAKIKSDKTPTTVDEAGFPLYPENPEKTKNKQILAQLQQAKRALESVKTMPEENMGSFVDGFLKTGIRNKIPFLSAALDIMDLATMKSIYDKKRKNESLTPSEELLLKSESAQSTIEQIVHPSIWYNGGVAAGASLAFMGEFVATGGVFDGTYQMAKTGIYKSMGSFGKNNMAKQLFIEPLSALIAVEAQTAANPQQYVKNTLERMSPGMELAFSEDGTQLISKLDYNTKKSVGLKEYNTGHNENAWTAFVKGYLLASAETGTERLGEVFSSTFKWAGTKPGVQKIMNPELMKRLSLGYYLEKSGLSLSEAKRKFIQHSMGYDGFGGEYWEEIVNVPLTNLITGDQALFTGITPAEDDPQLLLDWKNLGTIAVSIGATSIAFSGAQIASARKQTPVTLIYRSSNGAIPIKLSAKTFNEVLKLHDMSAEEVSTWRDKVLPTLKLKGNEANWVNDYANGLSAKKMDESNENSAPTTNSPIDQMMQEVHSIAVEEAQNISEEQQFPIIKEERDNLQSQIDSEIEWFSKEDVKKSKARLLFEKVFTNKENYLKKLKSKLDLLNTDPKKYFEEQVKEYTSYNEKYPGEFTNSIEHYTKALESLNNPISVESIKNQNQNGKDKQEKADEKGQMLNNGKTPTATNDNQGQSGVLSPKDIETSLGNAFSNLDSKDKKAIRAGEEAEPILQKRLDLLNKRLTKAESSGNSAMVELTKNDIEKVQSTINSLSGKKETSSPVEQEKPEIDYNKDYPIPALLVKELNANGDNKLLEGDEADYQNQRIERTIANGINKGLDRETIFQQLSVNGHIFDFGNDSIAMNNYIQNRIDGKETRSFAEFKNDPQGKNTSSSSAEQAKPESNVEATTNNPTPISDRELLGIVGKNGFDLIKNQKQRLGEESVNVNRVIDNANKIAEIDGESKITTEGIAEALFYEIGINDNWNDLKNAVKKGGFGINIENIKRIHNIGIELPSELTKQLNNNQSTTVEATEANKDEWDGTKYNRGDEDGIINLETTNVSMRSEYEGKGEIVLLEAEEKKTGNTLYRVETDLPGIISVANWTSSHQSAVQEFVNLTKEYENPTKGNQVQTSDTGAQSEPTEEAIIKQGEDAIRKAKTSRNESEIDKALDLIDKALTATEKKIKGLVDEYDTGDIEHEYPNVVVGKLAKKNIRSYVKVIEKYTGWKLDRINDNIPPAGGEVSVELNIPNSSLILYAQFRFDTEWDNQRGYNGYTLSHIFYRIEDPTQQGSKQYVGSNQYLNFGKSLGWPTEKAVANKLTPKELSKVFIQEANKYLPKENTQAITTEAEINPEVVKPKTTKQAEVEIGDRIIYKNPLSGYPEILTVENIDNGNGGWDRIIAKNAKGQTKYFQRGEVEKIIEHPLLKNKSTDEIPTPSPAPTPSKSEKRKQRVQIQDKELDDALEDLFNTAKKNSGKLGMNNIDPILLSKAIKVVSLYLRNNVYKFADIVDQVAAKNYQSAKELFDVLKVAYSGYQTQPNSDDSIIEQMDQPRDLKAIKFDEVAPESDYLDEVAPEEETNQEPADKVDGPDMQGFIEDVYQKLKASESFSNRTQFEKLAEQYNVVDKRMAMEGVESAIVRNVHDIANDDTLNENEKFDQTVKLYDLQPSLNIRTSESIDKQQYSTPAPYSFGGAMFVGGVENRDSGLYFEPSAGNGLFVAGINSKSVDVNEIDDTRLENLRANNYNSVTNQDAITPFYDREGKYDGVLTNPPFGGLPATVKIDGYNIDALEHLMAIRALDTMKDNGRAAIVVGGHTSYDAKGRIKGRDRAFLSYLYSHYNVIDVIELNGDLYRKQGTSLDTRMILIAGRKSVVEGFAPLQQNTNMDVVNSWTEFKNRINDAKQSAETVLQSKMDAGRNIINGTNDTNAGTPTENISGSTEQSTNKPNKLSNSSRRGRGKSSIQSGVSEQSANGTNGESEGVSTNTNEFGSMESVNDESTVPNYEPQLIDNTERSGTDISGPILGDDIRDNGKHDVVTTSKPVIYIPLSNGFSLGSEDDAINISGSIANGVYDSLKRIQSEVGNIDNWVTVKLGYPSVDEMQKSIGAEQIDAVALAIYNIEKKQGLIVGDMTGIGKGRIAASIIRYGIVNNKMPIFVTEKTGLFSDIYRDLEDIGFGEPQPFIFSNSSEANMTKAVGDEKLQVVHRIPGKEVITKISDGTMTSLPRNYKYFVTTYNMFDQSERDKYKRIFFSNLVENNAIIILDESHNASGGNLPGGPKKDKSGKPIINRATFMRGVVEKSSGTTFLSATYAKRPDNMPLYAVKTAIRDANISTDQLIKAIENGGVVLQEILAKNLASSGQMIRRERSYDGVDFHYPITGQEYKALGIKSNPQAAIKQRQQADIILEIVRDIIKFQKLFVKPIIEDINDNIANRQASASITKGNESLGISNSDFASKLYNIMNQVLLALKAEEVANMAIDQLKRDIKPTIFLMNTMEGFIKEMDVPLNEDFDNPDFSLVMDKGIDNTLKYTEKDAQGEPINHWITVDELSIEGQNEYNRIKKRIKEASTGLWLSPIDHVTNIIEAAGYSVGEITGRQAKVVSQKNGKVQLKPRRDTSAKKVRVGFNNFITNTKKNKYDVVIFNASGSTGISLHSSNKFTDQRQRSMIVLQPHHDINTMVQAFGRIFRSGQVNKPMFVIPSSDLPAENRIMMMFKSKINSLNANTSGDQEGERELIKTPDIINRYGDQVVSEYLMENPEINNMLMDPLKINSLGEDEEFKNTNGAAKKVTGNVAMLPSNVQEEFYNEVINRYNNLIDYLNEAGINTLKMETLPLNATQLNKSVIVQGTSANSPFGGDTYLSKYEVDVLKQPFEKNVLHKKIEEQLGDETPDNQVQRLVNEVNTYYENKQVEVEFNKNKDFDEKQIEKQNKINAIENEEDRANAQESYDKALPSLIDLKNASIEKAKNKLSKTSAELIYTIKTFKPKRSLMYSTGTASATPSVAIGIDINRNSKNPYSPSNIRAKIAILDSNQYAAIPLSQIEKIQSIINATNIYAPTIDSRLYDNWDHTKGSKNRSVINVLTGNVIQGYRLDMGQRGHIKSFTTSDGNIVTGIIVDDVEANNNKTVAVSIKNLLPIIDGLGQITTQEELVIQKQGNRYEIRVPKSTSKGGKYFLNEEIRNLVVGRNFMTRGDSMAATVEKDNIQMMLNILGDKFNESAEIDPKDLPNPDSSRSNAASNMEYGKMQSSDLSGENESEVEFKDPTGPKQYLNKYDQWMSDIDKLKINTRNSAFALLPPFGFALATWNTALDLIKAALAVSKTVDEAIQKGMAYLRAEHLASQSTVPMPDQDIQDYLKLLSTNPDAILNKNEITALRQQVARELKGKNAAFENKFYGSETMKNSDFKSKNKYSIANAQSKLLDKPNKAVGNYVADKTKQALQSKYAVVRVPAKLLKNVFQNLERDFGHVQMAERMYGVVDSRAITDAIQAINKIREALANEPDALKNIDQVLDPEIYRKHTFEEFIRAFDADHISNFGYTPTATMNPNEKALLYQGYLNDINSNFNKTVKTYNDLTPNEQAAYDMIRDVYDMIHDYNFVMRKISFPTYMLNKGNYSARMYDHFEIPDDMKVEVGNMYRLMQLDMYKSREGLTSWKIENNLQDPTYKLGKRLFQTLVNKAIWDYSYYLTKTKRDVVSSVQKPGFVKLSGHSYGPLNNKWVAKDIAEDFRGFFFTNHMIQSAFKALKAFYYWEAKGTLNPLKLASLQWYKKLFTVYMPPVHLGNMLGNVAFAFNIGISPHTFALNYWKFARGEYKANGPTMRYMMNRGLLGSKVSMEDVRHNIGDLSMIIGKTHPTWNDFTVPTKNIFKQIASGKVSKDQVLEYYQKNPFATLGDLMEYYYHSTDDLSKIAAFQSLIDLGIEPEAAANKIAESFQNKNRVGPAYKAAAMIPVIGPPFAGFVGDMVRIEGKAFTNSPLSKGLYLATISAMAALLSGGSGEDPDKRKDREDRPGFAKIPMLNLTDNPAARFIPIVNFFGPDIPLQWKMGDKEINVARFLSPFYLYQSPDDSDMGEIFKKLSPLPIDLVDKEETRNPNGSTAVMLAKNIRDPRFAFLSAWSHIDSDFTGRVVTDPNSTSWKPSTITEGEKTQNQLRFLLRSYVPYGSVIDDLRRIDETGVDYYERKKTKFQVVARFFGYNAQEYGDSKYADVAKKKIENKIYQFAANEKLLKANEDEFINAILNNLSTQNPEYFKKLYIGKIPNQNIRTYAYDQLLKAYQAIPNKKPIFGVNQKFADRLAEHYEKQAKLKYEAIEAMKSARRSLSQEQLREILIDMKLSKRAQQKLDF